MAVFVLWCWVSVEKDWDGNFITSLVLGVLWLAFGVVIGPAEVVHTTTNTSPENYTIECTSRICEVSVEGRLITVKDAYRYNILKNSTYTSLELVTEYAWWGNILNEELIVK